MKQLLKFELKKIFIRKVNLAAIILGLALIIILNIALIRDESLYLGDGNELEGAAAIKAQTEIENALTAELTEKFLTGFLREYQQKVQNNPLGYDYSLISTKSNLFTLIADNYTEWNDNWDWEALDQINTENGIGFYERRMEKIETLLNAEYSYGNYTDIEKDYWLQKAESIRTPFIWGSKNTWELIWRGIGLLFFQCFVITICLAPIFAGEFQNRTAPLILSAKHGKNKLIHAKIIASFVFTLAYISFCSILSVGLNVVTLGIDGWDLPVQLWNTIIPYRFNAVEACGLNLFIIFLIYCLLTAVTLMLSTVCKSQMVALALDILLFFGTVFLPSSKTSSLWNHILYLCPVHVADLKNVFKAYVSYQFGSVVISHLMMIIIVYLIITAGCLWYAGRNFRGHQVGK